MAPTFYFAGACALALCLTWPLEGAGGKSKKPAEAKGLRFHPGVRPSFRYGKLFRADFRAKIQGDVSGGDAAKADEAASFGFHRRRVGVEGKLLGDFDYEVEWELGATRNSLRDGFVNYGRLDALQVQGGKFKVPFSKEQVTGAPKLDFVRRSLMARELAPARDVGLMAHGRVLRRGLWYEAGLFRHDGENAHVKGIPTGGLTQAFRVRAAPERWWALGPAWRELRVGGAAALSQLPQGLNSLHGETARDDAWFRRMYVNGSRIRTGVEIGHALGPLGLQGELARTRDQRRGQSSRGDDLPDLLSSGWYYSATWVATGEKKAGGVRPRREFLRDGGLGAVELAFRQEAMGFRSADRSRPESLSLRAANFPAARDHALTFGVNWYLDRFWKVQANVVRERVESAALEAKGIGPVHWSFVLRVQFVN